MQPPLLVCLPSTNRHDRAAIVFAQHCCSTNAGSTPDLWKRQIEVVIGVILSKELWVSGISGRFEHFLYFLPFLFLVDSDSLLGFSHRLRQCILIYQSPRAKNISNTNCEMSRRMRQGLLKSGCIIYNTREAPCLPMRSTPRAATQRRAFLRNFQCRQPLLIATSTERSRQWFKRTGS